MPSVTNVKRGARHRPRLVRAVRDDERRHRERGVPPQVDPDVVGPAPDDDGAGPRERLRRDGGVGPAGVVPSAATSRSPPAGNSQRCSRSPPTPSGAASDVSGPALNPSSDTDALTRTIPMRPTLGRDRTTGKVHFCDRRVVHFSTGRWCCGWTATRRTSCATSCRTRCGTRSVTDGWCRGSGCRRRARSPASSGSRGAW